MGSKESEMRCRSLSPARLGFAHGWLRLNPTFLNFGIPGLLVDRLWIDGIDDLGVELLGDHKPSHEFAELPLQADVRLPWSIAISAASHASPIAACTFAEPASSAWSESAQQAGQILLLVGDTYRVQLSWAAIFDCTVGRVTTMSSTLGFVQSAAASTDLTRAA